MSVWEIAATAGGSLVAAAAVWKVIVSIFRGLRRAGHALDEVLGEPASGSRPAIPGWREKLNSLQADVALIKSEVNRNGGGSLRDVVDRLEAWTVEHSKVPHAAVVIDSNQLPIDEP